MNKKWTLVAILFIVSILVSWQKKSSEEKMTNDNTAKIDTLKKIIDSAMVKPSTVIIKDTVKKVTTKYVLELKDFDTLTVDSSGKVILVPKQLKLVKEFDIKSSNKSTKKKPPVKKKRE